MPATSTRRWWPRAGPSRSIRQQPLAHYNHAHFLLMNGEFEEGFEEYQWRRKARMLSDGDPVFDEPEWQGEPLAGRTLLLFAEYGLGDAINFVRYVLMLVGKGGPDLAPGAAGAGRRCCGRCCPMSRCLPRRAIAAVRSATAAAQPAADLPHHRRDHPGGDTPICRRIAVKLARWREALSDVSALKVGVVWAGNPGTRATASARCRRTPCCRGWSRPASSSTA